MKQNDVYYIDRKTKTKKKENVYGETALIFLYKDRFLNKIFSYCISYFPLFSRLYGHWQNTSFTKKKIAPFIQKYQINTLEFVKPLDNFTSFNDFFCRELKKECRPFISLPQSLAAPADGRYLVIPQIDQSEGFFVKGKCFSLENLLQSKELAREYNEGAMIIVRLCPTDYHRFHFPLSGIAHKPVLINGPLWSVSPIAVRKNIAIFSENKRMITPIENEECGTYLYIDIGATAVGSIHQTFQPGKVSKGQEKGFFSFGGSSLILLFKPNMILFDSDLINNSKQHIETLLHAGESLGRIIINDNN